ncbi:MAG: VWA domain-containing protein [Candidatus Omnitrophica bacterium]|nr:VWA domain-containing protein [Candidatus Omnitrophota bacterium]
MRFAAISLLYLFWTIPVLVFFYIWANAVRKGRLAVFVEKKLQAEMIGNYRPLKRLVAQCCMIAAVIFMLIAVLRPQWGESWQEVKRQGIDMMIALDTSNSMLAEDVLPSRLERAKLAIEDLVKKLNGDRVGLIAFTGTAFIQCPLTKDYNGFLLTLADMNTKILPEGGTSLREAINAAIYSYLQWKTKNRILIIITDGEDLEGGIDNALKDAKKAGIKIFCVGIGTKEGEFIPVKGEDGKMGFLKDGSGNTVKTKLNEEMLKKISMETGGLYVRSSKVESGLDLIYEKKISKYQKEDQEKRMERKYSEQFQIPLFIALFFLLLEPLVGTRKILFAILIFISAGSFSYAENSSVAAKIKDPSYDQKANNELMKKCEAVLSKNPDNIDAKYALGTVYYRKSEYDKALNKFLGSFSKKDFDMTVRSLHNAGNSKFRIAEDAEKTKKDEKAACGLYKEAAELYRKSVELNTKDDKETKINYEYTLNKIKDLENKMNQDQQKSKQNSNPNQNENGDSDKQNKNMPPSDVPRDNQNKPPEENGRKKTDRETPDSMKKEDVQKVLKNEQEEESKTRDDINNKKSERKKTDYKDW